MLEKAVRYIAIAAFLLAVTAFYSTNNIVFVGDDYGTTSGCDIFFSNL